MTLTEAKILRSADSMGLIMDNTGGREWYFKQILKDNNERIIREIEKSYSEVEFDFAKKLAEPAYRELLSRYRKVSRSSV